MRTLSAVAVLFMAGVFVGFLLWRSGSHETASVGRAGADGAIEMDWARLLRQTTDPSHAREVARRLGEASVAGPPIVPRHDRWKEVHAVEEAAEKRRRAIRRELSRLSGDVEWAGEYYFGDGLGINILLSIAPRSGMTYTWSGCLGTYDVNHGRVVEVDGRRIRVEWEVDTKLNNVIYEHKMPRRIVSDEWVFVPWDGEHFLISTRRMISFCNAVNSGRVWNHARRLQRGEHPPPERRGLPDVPWEYAPFLLDAPIEAEILGVQKPVLIGTFNGGGKKFQATATIDAGDESGLLPGMVVYVVSGEPRGEGEVVDTGSGTSTVAFRFAKEWGAPAAGARVSTRPVRSR